MVQPDLDYFGLFDSSPNPYLVLDRDLNIVGANRAYLASTKRELDDIVGRWAWDAFPTDPETLKQSIASFERVIRTKQPDTMALLKFDIPRPEEEGGGFEERYWTITHTPILNREGEVAFVMQHPIDVTELEKLRHAARMLDAEQPLSLVTTQTGILNRAQSVYEANLTLKADSDRLRRLFEQSPNPIVVFTGPNHVFELVNQAYRRIFVSRDVIGKPFLEALPEVAGQGFVELLDKVFNTGKPYIGHGLKVSLQQEPNAPLTDVYHDVLYQPLFDEEGKVSGVFCHVNDVTETYQVQAALRESQERLHEGMDAARMAVWDWDLASDAIRLSDNAGVILGGQWDRVTTLLQCVHPEDVQKVAQARQQATIAQPRYNIEYRFIRPDNGVMLWLENRSLAVFEQDGAQIQVKGVTLDITERKQAEQELHEANRRKDEFLAMLAHELRNPLAPIKAAAELLQIARLDEALVVKSSAIIARQANHMARLIDDLMDVSRVTRGQVKLEKIPIDASRLVQDALEQVRTLINARRHHLSVHTPPGSALVCGDPKRLVQVITNLLTNAAKYTPDGGNIDLAIEVQEKHVMLVVADNGIGMTPELASRAFELFTQGERTSDRSQGGLGIGLSLVKSLVAMHDGHVSAESRGPGEGSRFTVCLPRLAESVVMPCANQGGELQKESSPTLKVLVVDDNVDAAQMLAMFVEALGHQVMIEHSSRRALERAKIEVPDICLLDIGLPEMDGNELARRIRSQPATAQTKLIAVTGYGQEKDRKNSQAAGFNYHLVKPVDTSSLVKILSDIAGKQAA